MRKTDLERLRRRFRFLNASLFGVAIAATVIFLFISDVMSDLRAGWSLHFQGRDVTGQVTRLWREARECRGRTGLRICYDVFVAYEFGIEGQQYRGENSVTDTLFYSLSEGDPIALRYGANDPQLSEVTIFGEHRGWRAFGHCVLFMVALVLLLAGVSSKIEASYRMIYLRKAGVRRSAVVNRYVNALGFSDGRLSSILWEDETGATGQSRMMTATRLPNLGATITVYADPDNKLPTLWDGEFGKG